MAKTNLRKRKRTRSIDHPQGVKPWGSFWLQGGTDNRSSGLGTLASLSDDLILTVLCNLPARDLAHAAGASQALYCFCNHEELWKALTLQERQGKFHFRNSWRQTYLASQQPPARRQNPCSAVFRCSGIYSDLLYQPWLCATSPIEAAWLATDNVERRSRLSPQQFREEFEVPGRPVVVTDGAASWPACANWSRGYLLKAFDGSKVVVGEMHMQLTDYLAYMDGTHDEMPLYLFDKGFADKAPALQEDFQVPACFEDDLFSVMGERRPDHRWLIWGPARSGSSFHKDPNGTSAWNAVVRGCKKWVLFPPHALPPGVHASPDGADVASPVSLMEWFLKFHGQMQQEGCRAIEGVVHPGEALFVPHGWWHLAMNLEETVAVTQNFVSRVNLPHVLKFLRSRRGDLISGCDLDARAHLHDSFLAALKQRHPELTAEATTHKAVLPEAFGPQAGAGSFSFSFTLPPE